MNVGTSLQYSRHDSRICLWRPRGKDVATQELRYAGYCNHILKTDCLPSQSAACWVASNEEAMRPGLAQHLFVIFWSPHILSWILFLVWNWLIIRQCSHTLGAVVHGRQQRVEIVYFSGIDAQAERVEERLCILPFHRIVPENNGVSPYRFRAVLCILLRDTREEDRHAANLLSLPDPKHKRPAAGYESLSIMTRRPMKTRTASESNVKASLLMRLALGSHSPWPTPIDSNIADPQYIPGRYDHPGQETRTSVGAVSWNTLIRLRNYDQVGML